MFSCRRKAIEFAILRMGYDSSISVSYQRRSHISNKLKIMDLIIVLWAYFFVEIEAVLSAMKEDQPGTIKASR